MRPVVGMVVFLGSWAMIFLALFFSFLLIRVNAEFWPPAGFEELPILMPSINTLIMVASSVVYHRGWKALQRGHAQVYSRYLMATIALGFVFMLLQGRLWLSLWSGGLELSSGLFGGFFYLLTVFHALHVVVEPDRRNAIAHALRLATPDDIVLVAGKGHESYQVIGDEILSFDDRKVAAELMAAGGLN